MKLDVETVYRKIPMAVGYHYELIFLAKRGIACFPVSAQNALDKVIQ